MPTQVQIAKSELSNRLGSVRANLSIAYVYTHEASVVSVLSRERLIELRVYPLNGVLTSHLTCKTT